MTAEKGLQASLIERLSSKLVSQGLVSKQGLEEAIKVQKEREEPLGKVLVDLNLLTREELLDFIADELEIPHVDLSSYLIEPDVLSLVPEATARKYKILPLFKVENTLSLAMADPLNVFALDEIKLKAGLEVEPALASEESIDKAINEYYGGAQVIEEAVEEIDKTSLKLGVTERVPTEKLERITEQPPIVKLVNELILQAIKEGASDIHLEPQKRELDVRYRIDGILHKISTVPKNLQLPVTSRIKIMADMDITEKRMPQDGRIDIKLGERDIDLRVSTFPTISGEKTVLRVLDKSAFSVDLAGVGLSSDGLRQFRQLIKRPGGLILICGPTGSGKTTTLYALLNALNSPEKNIVTLEDPVEYEVGQINQGQINPKAGLTFASGLRTILRQDPDIIMVGEVRDLETAELAIRAALTGHLVLSTLHTMDAAGTLTRLTDMGIEPFLIASSISAVLAQRLVRKICSKCKEAYDPSPELLDQMGWSAKKDLKLYKGKGCKECRHTGFKGRTGLFELLTLNEEIRNLIISKASADVIKKAAAKAGSKSLREDGLDKVLTGITTLDEILRETQPLENETPLPDE